jgi:hypothetical protein
MPSPFPGMDPYLEHPSVFPNLHDKLIVHLEETLQPLLPEPYYAKGNQRVWVDYIEASRIPDVGVMKPGQPAVSVAVGNGGGVAVAEMPVKVTAPYIPWDEFREPFVEIYSREGEQPRLVTAIEVLSPSNKTPGQPSRAAYRQKQSELIGSQVHLVEIDLLRMGTHTTAVPHKELLRRCSPVDYHVCVHYFDQPSDFFIYPIQLADRLPKITIPLLPGDVGVAVELQSVLDQCYDRGPYRREVNYANDPPPPALLPEKLAWVKGVLVGKKG